MASPLPGADYLRPPVKCGTREEVLARMKEAIDKFMTNPQEPVSREQRMNEHFRVRHEKAVWVENARASLRPQFIAIGPRLPARAHVRVWYGRFGHARDE